MFNCFCNEMDKMQLLVYAHIICYIGMGSCGENNIKARGGPYTAFGQAHFKNHVEDFGHF